MGVLGENHCYHRQAQCHALYVHFIDHLNTFITFSIMAFRFRNIYAHKTRKECVGVLPIWTIFVCMNSNIFTTIGNNEIRLFIFISYILKQIID